MEHAVGPTAARFWAEHQVLTALGGMTAVEALDAGTPPKEVWAVVWQVLELPPADR